MLVISKCYKLDFLLYTLLRAEGLKGANTPALRAVNLPWTLSLTTAIREQEHEVAL